MKSRTFLTRWAAGVLPSAAALALSACGGGDEATGASSIDTPPRAHANDVAPASSAAPCPAALAVQVLCVQTAASSPTQSESEVIE